MEEILILCIGDSKLIGDSLGPLIGSFLERNKSDIGNNVKVLVYRFQNVFGKWCRPNYNSAIATFCHNIARNLSITVNDQEVIMNLMPLFHIYIMIIIMGNINH